MSTITKELAKLFRKITNSEIDAEGNAHVVLSPADSLLINNARIALASLEAEAVACIDRANLDYLESGADADVWPASGAGSDDVLLYAAPQLPQPAQDYFSSLVSSARVRADKAMRKFPQPNYVLNKVAEESGEVIKAVIHYTEGREEWANVEGEIVDNLAMLIRLVTEGDQVIGFTPPESCRAAMLQGKAEPVSNRDELPDIVGWIRSDYHSDRRIGDAPIFILGRIDPSDAWGVKYIPLTGNSPVTQDTWIPVSERMPDKYDFDIWVFSPSKGIHDGIQWDGCEFADDEYQFKINDVSHWMKKIYPAAPQQEVKP